MDFDQRSGDIVPKKSCSCCQIRMGSLFSKLCDDELETAAKSVVDTALSPGDRLYNPGDFGDSLYTLREGLIKLQQPLSDGSARIVNLLGQGQVVGLEAIVTGYYEHSAIALLPTKLCKIPRTMVDSLAPKLHSQLMQKWHEALTQAHACTRELGTGHARQRVARLFLIISPSQDGLVRLFGREDVGLLLGLTTETVSRMIAGFKRKEIIHEVSLNRFAISIDKLQALSGGSDINV